MYAGYSKNLERRRQRNGLYNSSHYHECVSIRNHVHIVLEATWVRGLLVACEWRPFKRGQQLLVSTPATARIWSGEGKGTNFIITQYIISLKINFHSNTAYHFCTCRHRINYKLLTHTWELCTPTSNDFIALSMWKLSTVKKNTKLKVTAQTIFPVLFMFFFSKKHNTITVVPIDMKLVIWTRFGQS